MSRKRTKGMIPGQGQPIDAATDLFWRDNENFAEVFNKTVFNGLRVSPDQLGDLNVAESTMLRLNDGATTTLKQTRDLIKSVISGGIWLVILGIENQNRIDPLMPFRVWELNFLNIARQVDEIRKKHKAERKANQEARKKGEKIQARELSAEEVLSGFYRDDKLTPVITLVIYYGEEEWKYPRKLSDLFIKTPFTTFADEMPMYLLDVRHMTQEKLDAFSPALKAFFGFLIHDRKDDLQKFVMENEEIFSNLPEQTVDALIEITHSKELEQYKKEYRTAEGGVNVCYGIQVYGDQRELKGKSEGKLEGTIGTLQDIGFSRGDTIKKIMTKYQLKENDATEAVMKYWKEITSNSDEKKEKK